MMYKAKVAVSSDSQMQCNQDAEILDVKPGGT